MITATQNSRFPDERAISRPSEGDVVSQSATRAPIQVCTSSDRRAALQGPSFTRQGHWLAASRRARPFSMRSAWADDQTVESADFAGSEAFIANRAAATRLIVARASGFAFMKRSKSERLRTSNWQ